MLSGTAPANSAPVIVDTLPDTGWRYSGGGYSVAQQLMVSVSGRDFASLMNDAVLGPLGMKHSTYAQPLPASLQGAAATAHDDAGRALPGKWHTYPEQAAAGLWTTPSDLARFVIALQQADAGTSTKIISQPMARQMLTRLKGDYGLGIEVREIEGERSFTHGGTNAGYRAQLYAITGKGEGVVVMTNGDQGESIAVAIMRSVAAEYRWKDLAVAEKPVVPVSEATLARYAGRYQLGQMIVTVAQNADGLAVSAPPLGAQPRQFYPSSETAFFNLEDWIDFHFDANQTGGFDMIVNASGTYKATRLP